MSLRDDSLWFSSLLSNLKMVKSVFNEFTAALLLTVWPTPGLLPHFLYLMGARRTLLGSRQVWPQGAPLRTPAGVAGVTLPAQPLLPMEDCCGMRAA